MKKLSIILFFLLLLGCTDYKPNYQINSRRPPIVIIAIDKTTKSVIMRDGSNQVFTITDNATTSAIVNSLKIGDTLRTPISSKKSISKKF